MKFNIVKPRKALNKAFLKLRPNRKQIEDFKHNLKNLLVCIKETESEEFHKNLVADLLKQTYYNPLFSINTKGRTDLVIHNGASSSDSVGVLIETKKPTNRNEMISVDSLNKKAMQELLLYFLRERITHKNINIKHIIATNAYEWFIFDATQFDKLFAENKQLVAEFKDFEEGRLSGTNTDFFYTNVAAKYLDDIDKEIDAVHIDLRNYKQFVESDDKETDKKLIALYKILSPEHLLKLPFANDSNTLDRSFYNELLHIIGLTEVKESGKKLIARKPKGERNSGSLIENAIVQLDTMDKLSNIDNPAQYGETRDEQLYNLALELVITWINRILFLKLLESQLISYHGGDSSYAFLNIKKIHDYDDLNTLFFSVLARKYEDRMEEVTKAFKDIPYLNSSLFEVSPIEQKTIAISNLRDERTLPIISSTVLKDATGKKLTGDINSLEYLFDFLDAYDFSSEGSEDVQDENKALINASVLGLIFEKINGYKDGSFFTPGFITMYMARETIRRAVIQKFNDKVGKDQFSDITDIYNSIGNNQTFTLQEANEVVNSLKVCDPAVGSGHFLVSALNEIIAVKSDLGILADKSGRTLNRYTIEVVNDELIVTDENGDLFEYHFKNQESQRVQETLFTEKQTIIENCLFGVDINQNSVNICRLRLWIELLKNAYYKSPISRGDGGVSLELETLPNIDINIKTGNSLISKFDLYDTQFTVADKRNLEAYKDAVRAYKITFDKRDKSELKSTIDKIKANFKGVLQKQDPREKRLNQITEQLHSLNTQVTIGEPTKKEQDKKAKLEKEITELSKQIEQEENSNLYDNAFEWRFEFPEVLDDDGNFVGFDAVIGNPPYIQLQKESGRLANELQVMKFQTFAKTGDIYSIFYEKSNRILKDNGLSTMITSNKWMRAAYGKNTREFFSKNTLPIILIDFGGVKIFDEATVDTNILLFKKAKQNEKSKTFVVPFANDFKIGNNIFDYIDKKGYFTDAFNTSDSWIISSPLEARIKEKIERIGTPLKDWDVNIYRGVLTGFNEAFIIDGETKDRLIAEDPKSAEIIKPILRGRDIKRYKAEFADKWLINSHNGYKDKNGNRVPRIDVENDYPVIKKHLDQYLDKIQKRQDKGETPYNLRNCAYIEEFEKEKIVFIELMRLPKSKEKDFPKFMFDENIKYSSLNTTYILTGKSLKFLIAFLNSKFSVFIYPIYLYFFDEGGFRFLKEFFGKIPIPQLSKVDQQPFIEIVDKILAGKERGEDTTTLEAQIDRMVYALYDLTEEEIAYIEESVR